MLFTYIWKNRLRKGKERKYVCIPAYNGSNVRTLKETLCKCEKYEEVWLERAEYISILTIQFLKFFHNVKAWLSHTAFSSALNPNHNWTFCHHVCCMAVQPHWYKALCNLTHRRNVCITACISLCDMSHVRTWRGRRRHGLVFHKPEPVCDGNRIYLGKWMRWIHSGCVCVCVCVCVKSVEEGVLLFFWSPSCWPDFLSIFACTQTESLWTKHSASSPLYLISTVTDSLSLSIRNPKACCRSFDRKKTPELLM